MVAVAVSTAGVRTPGDSVTLASPYESALAIALSGTRDLVVRLEPPAETVSRANFDPAGRGPIV